jgi:hypothetical protein
MSKAEELSGFYFARLADVRAPKPLEVLTMRHMELIASIKALSDMLRIKRPGTAHFQATEALVNRMITMARRDYDALLADGEAVANLRKETGDDP